MHTKKYGKRHRPSATVYPSLESGIGRSLSQLCSLGTKKRKNTRAVSYPPILAM
ncbi:hypothetical protein EVA_07787 [gut metagenome]|uniref:Uncharacterized protein n=1 Tax=gut metagenome TaxID=749906 RepID=J9GUJ5_9ZZZZ